MTVYAAMRCMFGLLVCSIVKALNRTAQTVTVRPIMMHAVSWDPYQCSADHTAHARTMADSGYPYFTERHLSDKMYDACGSAQLRVLQLLPCQPCELI